MSLIVIGAGLSRSGARRRSRGHVRRSRGPVRRLGPQGVLALSLLAACGGEDEKETCDRFDATYAPSIEPADFSTTIDNPLMPFGVGAAFRFEAPGETIDVTVTSEARTVMGVPVVVVRDTVKDESGALVEDTRDWYAQDSAGSVWYFGEETAEYEEGVKVSTEGSWEAGVDGAQPGIIMKAAPAVGDTYRQEYLACEAEDMGEVVEVGVDATVQTGSYTGCVRIRDYTPLEPAAAEIKTYCPGVGLVSAEHPETGELLEELVQITLP